MRIASTVQYVVLFGEYLSEYFTISIFLFSPPILVDWVPVCLLCCQMFYLYRCFLSLPFLVRSESSLAGQRKTMEQDKTGSTTFCLFFSQIRKHLISIQGSVPKTIICYGPDSLSIFQKMTLRKSQLNPSLVAVFLVTSR